MSIYTGNYTIKSEKIKDGKNITEYLYTENSLARNISYGSVILGMSMGLFPVMVMSDLHNIILPSIMTTGLIFGGSTLYVHNKKVGELSAWEPALTGGLFGILGCGLTGLGSLWLFGPNIISSMLFNIDTYAGIPLFTGLIAYDTHLAIESYNKKVPDHLGCSLSLYLDTINLFVKIMEIFKIINENKN